MKPESRRIKVGGYSSTKLHARRDKRRHEAEARQGEYDKLTVAQRLLRAKKSPGQSKREIIKLEKLAKAA